MHDVASEKDAVLHLGTGGPLLSVYVPWKFRKEIDCRIKTFCCFDDRSKEVIEANRNF